MSKPMIEEVTMFRVFDDSQFLTLDAAKEYVLDEARSVLDTRMISASKLDDGNHIISASERYRLVQRMFSGLPAVIHFYSLLGDVIRNGELISKEEE